MNNRMKSQYQQFRNAGYTAAESLRAVKIVDRWENTSHLLRRIGANPEQEGYFSVYGEPAGYVDIYGKHHTTAQEREEICDTIERDGCWIVFSEWRASEHDEWQMADSVGMCTGYRDPLSPLQNCYVVDLMQSALDAIENSAIAATI